MLLSLLLCAAPVFAAVYKWVDKDGHVTFSQTPPPEQAGKASRVTMGGEGRHIDVPDYVRENFCDVIGDVARKIAGYMVRGYSADRALTASYSSDEQEVVKAVVAFVYGFQDTGASPGRMGDLARNQCLNGAYSKYLENYVRIHHPELIHTDKPHRRPGVVFTGTGWPVGTGYVLTNNHVIEGAHRITLTRPDGKSIKATVARADQTNDLALLKVDDPRKLPPSLTLAPGDAPLGSRVFTIGYPHVDVMGHTPKLTTGVVSASAGLGDDARFYQISVPVQGGNSGGPLLDMHGRVVGVVTSKLNAVAVLRRSGDLPENVNYAIKTTVVSKFLRSRMGNGHPAGAVSSADEPLEKLAAHLERSVLLVTAR
ncbi:MAG TPA: trypsin-like peptidase domain-containing protein [Gammaproteobacteria bacterium]|nr:trypsin-like peptidase domain-containing protein [Gammaproteobacteria bacterium]